MNNDRVNENNTESKIASDLENLEEAASIPPIPDVPVEDLVHNKTPSPKERGGLGL